MSKRSKKSKSSTCEEFAEILGGTILTSRDNLCAVTKTRNLPATILGRPTNSPLVNAALFSFELSPAAGREALNLGETPLLQEEANEFISVLRRFGIIVTGFHNHWLFEQPRIMYLHFESIDEPLEFARKVARAFAAIEEC
jgi:hypothetical protein